MPRVYFRGLRFCRKQALAISALGRPRALAPDVPRRSWALSRAWPAQRLLVLLLALAAAGWVVANDPLNDGEPHGDPPFLVEEGWRPLLNGKDLAGWHAQGGGRHAWFTTTAVRWERLLGPAELKAKPAPGGRIVNGDGKTKNLVTTEKFGDMELYLEFMLSKGSNSGVYLHGLYEVQVFDSWGSDFPPKTSDGGGIYHRWINNRAVGGSAPLVNASRRPGQWQSYQIWFQGPRFDEAGKKISNARFHRVLFNGQLVQTDVEVDGGTRAHMPIEEAIENPLMLQGDHGPVAYKNIYWRPLREIRSR